MRPQAGEALRGPAAEDVVRVGVDLGERLLGAGDELAPAWVGVELGFVPAQIPGIERPCGLDDVVHQGTDHGDQYLEVDGAVVGGAAHGLGQHGPFVLLLVGRQAEAGERGEEVVVTGLRAGLEVFHGPGAHHGVVARVGGGGGEVGAGDALAHFDGWASPSVGSRRKPSSRAQST